MLAKRSDAAGDVEWADPPSVTKADYTLSEDGQMATLSLELTNAILLRGAKLTVFFRIGYNECQGSFYLPAVPDGMTSPLQYYTSCALGSPDAWSSFIARIDFPDSWTEGAPSTEELQIEIRSAYTMYKMESGIYMSEMSTFFIQKLFVEF